MQRRRNAERVQALREWYAPLVKGLPEPVLAEALVGEAYQRFRSGGAVPDDQVEPLEAIVVQHVRPAVPARGEGPRFEGHWSHLNDAPARRRLAQVIAAVGQVETSGAETPAYAGTAFRVAPDLVMTTRSVAESLVVGDGAGGVRFRPGSSVSIDFGSGADADPIDGYPIASVVLMHAHLDIALLRLAAAPPGPWLALWAEDPGLLQGREVAVVGYPQFDQRYGTALQKAIFGASPGVKRVMPGKVIQPRLHTSLGRQGLALTHDSITLGGRSGAPVVDIESGRVVGVSFASFYLDANFAVPISELARDPEVWDAGLQFDGGSRPLRSPWSEDDAGPLAASAPAESLAASVPAVPPAADAGAPSIREAVERLVARLEPEAFREFLRAQDLGAVVRAVPARKDNAELVRALERRGLLDERFLEALVAAVPHAPATLSRAALSPWLPQSILSRALWAVAAVPPTVMELHALGSPWRDYLLGTDGLPTGAAATLERLAYDTRPEVARVLAWLVRRLYESVDTTDNERVDALYEALRHLEGGADGLTATAPAVPLGLAGPPTMRGLGYLTRGLEAARSVGLVRLQGPGAPAPTGSSAWLLTPDLVVMPGHVLLSPSPGSARHFDTDGADERAAAAVLVLDFDGYEQKPSEHALRSLELLDLHLDMAIVRLASPVHDRLPLRIGADPLQPHRTRLAMFHHPRLGPKQMSREGLLLRASTNDLIYLIDTEPGSAGAPIFDEEWRVVGFHRAFTNYRAEPGQPSIRAKLGTPVAAILSRLRDRQGHTGFWREVVAAQPALKSVNVNLAAELATAAKVPVVLQLLGDAPLDGVDGFHVTSQSAGIVTGLCEGPGLNGLIDHPRVLSVDVSRPAGSPECAVSIPHIRADLVHGLPHEERGARALIGFIDSGIDVRHRAFCDADGHTRIVAFWDQHDRRSPAGDTATAAVAESDAGRALVDRCHIAYGAVYAAEDIQRFLDDPARLPPTFPPAEAMMHGTVVAGVAAGRRTGTTEDHFAGGVAPDARLIVVRYDLQNASVGYSKGHIDALEFLEQMADLEQLPMVVNISNGMNAGAHDGTSPVERRCNAFSDYGQKPGRIIVKSAGNERRQGRHAALTVPQGAVKSVRWRSQNQAGLAPSQLGDELELWFHHLNSYRFRLKAPSSNEPSPYIDGTHRTLNEYLPNGNLVAAQLTPYRAENGGGFLNIKVSPGEADSVETGVWLLEITGLLVPQREPLHAWLEQMPDRHVFFQDFIDEHFTVTIPGTAEHVISVGAIAPAELMTPYEDSSWGPTRKGLERPDIVAPGVAVFGPGAARGDLRALRSESGTSLAAPHVSGAIALALSACVKAGRPPHSSFRIRGALQETARHGTRMWNEETGYGALDAAAFFETLQSDN